MDFLADVWGLSFNQTICLVALLLIMVDFFLPSDVPTHIAYVLLCMLVARNIEANILVKIFAGVVAWFGFVLFHYVVWTKLVQRIVDKWIAPDKLPSGVDDLVGLQGTICMIEGVTMVRVRGDVWPCKADIALENDDLVEIASFRNGLLHVTKAKEGS